jgi:hypothetical protein
MLLYDDAIILYVHWHWRELGPDECTMSFAWLIHFKVQISWVPHAPSGKSRHSLNAPFTKKERTKQPKEIEHAQAASAFVLRKCILDDTYL